MFFPGLEIGIQSLVSWVDVEYLKPREELCANFGTAKIIFGKYEGGCILLSEENFMSWSWYEAKEKGAGLFQGILTLIDFMIYGLA